MQKKSPVIPNMVFEPAKTDYRGLKTIKERNGVSASGTEFYTPGNDSLSPFRFNPLELLPGIEPDEHIENTLCCLQAAMPMSGPLPALLREALEELYENHQDRERPPVFRDLVATAETIVTSDRYSAETRSDIRTALSVRIGALSRGLIGRVFQCRRSIPSIGHLMKVPSIIEAAILPPEQACLLGLFVFNGIREYLRTIARGYGTKCPYVLFIEEAHNIIGLSNNAQPSEENADPKAYATEFICRMMGECGGYDVSIAIIDQLPSAVAAAVLKHAGAITELRTSHREDREMVGNAMLADEMQIEDMGRLRTGEAYHFREGYHCPRRIRTVNIHKLVDFNKTVGDQQLLSIIRGEPWFQETAHRRVAAELEQLEEYMDAFEKQRIAMVDEVKTIVATRRRLLASVISEGHQRQLGALRTHTESVRRRFHQLFREFHQRIYRRYMPVEEGLDSVIQSLRDKLVHHFDSVIRPDVDQLSTFMGDLIAKFMDPRYKEIGHAKAQ